MKRYRAYFDTHVDFDALNDEEADKIANRLMPRRCSYADRKELHLCKFPGCKQWLIEADKDDNPDADWNVYCFEHRNIGGI